MKKNILTEVVSLRLSKEEKDMLREVQEKYYFDIFHFIRDVIREEYNKKQKENSHG